MGNERLRRWPSPTTNAWSPKRSHAICPPGRGAQTRLAAELGVSAATVSRWIRHQSCPDPNRWPAIEDALGLPRGQLAREALAEGASAPDLTSQLADHEARIARLEATVRQLVEAATGGYTLAAEGLPTEDDGDEVNRPAPPVEPDMHP